VDGGKRNQIAREVGLEVLSPILADFHHALGWVAAQVLLFFQPLLRGWVDESSLEQTIQGLEDLLPIRSPEDR